MILNNAQGQWVDGKNNNQWLVVDGSGNELYRLPEALKDFEAMGIIHFGRKFEKLAFDEGVAEGLKRGAHASKAAREMAAAEIEALKQHAALEIGNLEAAMEVYKANYKPNYK